MRFIVLQNQNYKPSTSSGPVIHELDATDILNSNNIGKGRGPILWYIFFNIYYFIV